MAIEDRNLEPGTQLIAKYKKEEYKAEVIAGEDGKIMYRLADRREFKSPSSAGTAITNKACNGWAFWSVEAGGAPSEAKEPEGEPSEETETGEQMPTAGFRRVPNQKGIIANFSRARHRATVSVHPSHLPSRYSVSG